MSEDTLTPVTSELVRPDEKNLPGIAFALRFGNDTGFVQQFFTRQRDLVARELRGTAWCLLAFRRLGNNPVYAPRWATEVQVDFYDRSPGSRERIRQFVCKNRIILVIFQGASPGEVDTGFLGKLGVNTINTEDSSFDEELKQPFFRGAAKFLMRRVMKRNLHDIYIANTRGQSEFLQRFARYPARRLRVVHYGVDPEYYRPADRRTACLKIGVDPNAIWLMAAAQARPEKRIDMLIEAVRRVKEARPAIRTGFFYVGDGVMSEQWNELARNSLPGPDCRFFGKQTDMRVYYQAASAFIHGASRESFGLVIAEAMASGLPVVATHAHGPAEIIDHGRTGYLVGRDDWKAFAEAILAYVDDSDLRQRHGAMSRQRCLDYFTCDREASELANVVRPFLGSTHGRR